MDGDFRINPRELISNLETAEVLSLYFPILRRVLLIDFRYTPEDEPMVKVVPMAGSVEERFRSIRRMRPHLPRPESLTLIPWPKFVDSLVRLGIYDRVVQRLVALGFKRSVKACEEALEELRGLEREEITAVITGENYHTIWTRK